MSLSHTYLNLFLAPSLFLYYINDILTRLDSTISLCVDDKIAYLVNKSNSEALTLQRDLDKLAQWGQLWKMALHQDKCNMLIISRNKTPVQFIHCLHGHVLQSGEWSLVEWGCRLYNRETNLVPGLIPGVLQNRQGCIKIVYSQQWLSEFDLTGNFLSSYLHCLLCLCIKKLWLALSNEKWGHQFVYTIIQILSHDVDEL
jgi:hypothetical protein